MRISNSWLLTLLAMCMSMVLQAHVGPTRDSGSVNTPSDQVSFREDCDNAVTQIDQQINNVRARLTTGGDVFWDGGDGRYIVPKTPPGVPEVSSIYAGAVWLGGKDPGGNLKVAAQTYGRGTGEFDFYPGPLGNGDPDFPGGPENDPTRGTIGRDTCAQWDKFFVVDGANVDAHVKRWRVAQAAGETSIDPETIPEDVLGWPARGNRFFEGVHDFRLPNTEQGLAGFWDQNFNTIYEPDLGDYPIIEIRGCLDQEPKSSPDEMIFWIYNDAGNDHRETQSPLKIQMEVQVQAFAYKTNDDINSMTFQRYKLINRAIERIDTTYFAIWIDADLGCYTDDFVGCDVDRSLAYIYNSDATDGQTGCSCPQGVQTYCEEVPIVGVDYFRGPTNEFDEELGMSSFTYYNNATGDPTPAPGTTDPQTAQEYYNYLSGRWRDGTPFTFGGDAYQQPGEQIPYAFTDAPNETDGWSMCSQGLPDGDRRTIQASGPFTLFPGAVNELIVGVVWVPDQRYPCPAITRLQKADDVAQDLFDNCFNLTRGPDAPDVDWVELDQEIIAVFSNNVLTSNNPNEEYQEEGLGIPPGQDSLYRFEGYKLFQLSGPNVSLADVDDPDKVRVIYQVDKKNNIEKIFNWEGLSPDDNETPTEEIFFVPKLMVDGENKGIRHTFKITEDQFAETNRTLVNHRKYYFAAVAYAYNNYLEFDPASEGDQGQPLPYLEGDRNIGDGENAFYTVIPRKILDRSLNANYGDGAVVTRIDGLGTGNNFLDISDETRSEIEELIRADDAKSFDGQITYKGGFGPINVQIFNPLGVVDGEYELTFTDDNLANQELETPAFWTLRSLTDPNAPLITAEKSIDDINEQIIRQYGISVSIEQVIEPGSDVFGDESNGFIGYTEEYMDEEASPWFFTIPDNLPITTGNPVQDGSIFDFIATNNATDVDYEEDPNQSLSGLAGTGMVPYYLANWRNLPNGNAYVTPAWANSLSQSLVRSLTSLETLNNVDIVFTSDKSLWSRCVIVETMNPSYTSAGYNSVGEVNMFDLRDAPSVSKEAGSDGLPMADANPPEGEEMGMGWFPGYAVDVETGTRLNIFFGENSVYTADEEGPKNGADMMFNPSDQFFIPPSNAGGVSIFNYPLGGQHFIYVSNQPYDRCAQFLDRFTGSSAGKSFALRNVMWTGMVVAPGVQQMTSYADGLIPNDLIVKLRVKNPYQNYYEGEDMDQSISEFNGYPTYRFKLDGKQAGELEGIALDDALQSINVVPNPYYGFSEYEDSQFENIVKITNLPQECVVTIYSLDGKFIRKYNRDEVGSVPTSPNRSINIDQINPDIEWDLKNFRSIPIASGVYLIHVSAPGLGERTLKWFGVNRQFDPSGL